MVSAMYEEKGSTFQVGLVVDELSIIMVEDWRS
jgi:hypothetical protein